jgi:glutamine synthetase
VEENYKLEKVAEPASLPANLNEAILAMEKSALVRETLGEHVFEYFLRNKRAEWQEYRKQVTAYELDRYLPVL